MPLNPAELEIFKNQLTAVAEEMGTSLIRSAFSANIKERRDLSCALFNSEGEMIAQAAHIPVHLGSMSFSTKAILDEGSVGNGDIFILNDPFRGGTHLPDITCIEPFFVNDRLEFLLASRAHHADVGGKTPGSMPLSTSIHEEGIIIPPTRICKNGKFNEKLFNSIINQTRNPEEREGDFRAQLSSLKTGRKRLSEIIDKYSISKIKSASESLLDYSEKIMRKTIDEIPDGTYEFKDYLDDDGAGTEDIKIQVKVEVKKSDALVDFQGSSKNVKGCLNTPLSVTTAAVIYCFQCLAPDELPLNSGPLRAIKVKVDDDSILNAKYPSAVAGGNVETSQRVVDVVFGALSKAVPEKIQAASAGTMNNITFGGINTAPGTNFTYYETLGGGMGGRKGFNGVNAVQTHMTNTLNTPIESLERELPVMIESYSIRYGSGGSGKYSGGNGLVREYRFLQKSEVTLITERRRNSPWGVKGGKNGLKGKNILVDSNGRSKEIHAKCSFQVNKDEIVRIETPGGGGWGC